MAIEQIPRVDSDAFYAIQQVYDNARADAIAAGRGVKAARTRLRVNLMQIIKLCKQARKDIPPVS
jgi:hypothetical protein